MSLLERREKLLTCLEAVYKDESAEFSVYNKTLEDMISKISSDNLDDFVALSADHEERVSYARKPADKIDDKRRVNCTFPRYVRKQLEVSADLLPDHILQKINGVVFSSVTDYSKYITLVKGEDITDAYRDSFGGSSCMTNGHYNKVSMYENNPNKVQLLMYDDNRRTARALVWKTDQGNKIVDRIYPNDGHHIFNIKAWADKNGYIFRNNQSTPHYSDEPLYDDFYYITLKHSGIFPFMDSFMHAKIRKKTITITNDHTYGDKLLYCVEGGSYLNIECDTCTNRPRNTYEVVEDHVLCENCLDYNCTDCSVCGDTCIRRRYRDRAEEWVCSICSENDTICERCGACTDKVTTMGDTRTQLCDWCLPENKCKVCKTYNQYLIEGVCLYCEKT